MDLKQQILVALGIDKEVNLQYQAKLVDGTIIVSEAENLEAGIAISILAEDGSQMPLPVGQYETEDGQGFSVEEEGIVAELYNEETEEDTVEEAEEEEMAEETTEEVTDEPTEEVEEAKEVEFDKEGLINEIGSVIKELLEEVKVDIERLDAELNEMKEKNTNLEAENKDLTSEVEKLSKEPADKPVTINKFADKKELSKVDYKNLSRQEKYWYNINNKK
tara:strand:- start:576 stop:1235 length:660 start_codon:yes stop_codon:yes gene_type:complete